MTEEDYNNWKNYLNKEYPDNVGLIQYLDSFKDKDIPIIFNIQHLSLLLGIDRQILVSIVNSSKNFYRTFTIPKRSGEKREISAPYAVLKFIQRWILDNILENTHVNDCATGFLKNKSILNNVRPHLAAQNLLKIDLKDFFPSISFKRIFSVFKKYGYSNKVSYCLAKICCLNDSLPQGACTSPYLANIVAKRLDSRLYKLSSKYSLNYTRYADDITISGTKLPWKMFSYINAIIQDAGFTVNNNKTRLINGNSKKIVTGISIGKNVPQLPRSYKRNLRHQAFILLHMSKQKYVDLIFLNDPIFLERIIGKFRFWCFIEATNSYAKKTLKDLILYSHSLSNE